MLHLRTIVEQTDNGAFVDCSRWDCPFQPSTCSGQALFAMDVAMSLVQGLVSVALGSRHFVICSRLVSKTGHRRLFPDARPGFYALGLTPQPFALRCLDFPPRTDKPHAAATYLLHLYYSAIERIRLLSSELE